MSWERLELLPDRLPYPRGLRRDVWLDSECHAFESLTFSITGGMRGSVQLMIPSEFSRVDQRLSKKIVNEKSEWVFEKLMTASIRSMVMTQILNGTHKISR